MCGIFKVVNDAISSSFKYEVLEEENMSLLLRVTL